MLNKINIIPIVTEHFHTFRVPRNNKILLRDFVLFLVMPILPAWALATYAPKPSESFLNVSLTIHTLFIPLLVNVLFVIYGIQEKRGTNSAKPRTEKLLHELYKNLSYAVLVSFGSVVASVLVLSVGSTQATTLLGSRHGVVEFAFEIILYWLMGHLLLTVLMIVRRTHVLLSGEFDRRNNDPNTE